MNVRSPLRTWICAAAVVVATAAPMPALATDDPASICPPLGSRAEAIAFFTDRGFPASDETPLGDGFLWTSRRGNLIALVEGADLASRIRLEADFTADPTDPETEWFWSTQDVIDILTWSPELRRQYVVPLMPPSSMEIGPDLPDDEANWPGGWSIDTGDRDGRMEVSIDADGMHVVTEVSAKVAPRFPCDPDVPPSPGP